MPAQHDQGLCLRQWDWSETSQTAVIFARSLGLLRVLAKGSKRPKAPYSGGLEMLTRGDLGVILRPNSELALLTEWDLTQTFPALRQSYGAHNAGLYVSDLITHLIRDHDPHPGLFDSAVECLNALGPDHDTARELLVFQWRAVVESGFRPVFDADARTGEALVDAPSSGFRYFNPELGGVIATDPREADPPDAPQRSWRVRQSTLDLLNSLDREPSAAPGVSDPETIDRANRLLASYIRHALGMEPPTMSVVFPSGLSR